MSATQTTQRRMAESRRVLDLLDDPIVELVMRRDGVTRDEVLGVLEDMRCRLFGPFAGSGAAGAPRRAALGAGRAVGAVSVHRVAVSQNTITSCAC